MKLIFCLSRILLEMKMFPHETHLSYYNPVTFSGIMLLVREGSETNAA